MFEKEMNKLKKRKNNSPKKSKRKNIKKTDEKKQFLDEELIKKLQERGFTRNPASQEAELPVKKRKKIRKSQSRKGKPKAQKITEVKKESFWSRITNFIKIRKTIKPVEEIKQKKEAIKTEPKIQQQTESNKEEIKLPEKIKPTEIKPQEEKKGFFSGIKEAIWQKKDKQEELEPITVISSNDNTKTENEVNSSKETEKSPSISQLLKNEILPVKQSSEEPKEEIEEKSSSSNQDSSGIDILFSEKKKKPFQTT